MKHQVGAESEWLLPRWRQEGVVHNYECTGRATKLRELLDVRNAKQRIARCLDPQQIGGFGQRGADGSLVTEVDEIILTLPAFTPRIKQAIRSAVAVMRSYDPPAARNEVADERDGSHAGCRDDTARTELQFGNGRAEQIARRISR